MMLQTASIGWQREAGSGERSTLLVCLRELRGKTISNGRYVATRARPRSGHWCDALCVQHRRAGQDLSHKAGWLSVGPPMCSVLCCAVPCVLCCAALRCTGAALCSSSRCRASRQGKAGRADVAETSSLQNPQFRASDHPTSFIPDPCAPFSLSTTSLTRPRALA